MAFLFLNDRVVDEADARIAPSDAGLLHGIGLFETMRAYHGVTFRLDAHLERLFASADALGLEISQPRERIAAAVPETLEANALDDARIRLTVTRGPIDDESAGSTLLITATGQVGWPAELYRSGMAVAIAGPRINPTDPMAGHKTLNYWPRLMTLRAAQSAGFGEAVWFTTDGRLTEGCVSNLFIAAEGVLLTPPTDTPVLPGVTRAAVIELARADGIETAERPISHAELLDADEVFLTNSTMEVMPVVMVERRAIPADAERPAPGPLTAALASLYRELIEKETRR